MAGSLLQSFVSGTRQMLTVQLFVSVGAVALAGWTLGVTNELIRERDRLRDRVIQLEETIAGRGIVVPDTPNVVEEPAPSEAADAYPDEIGPLAEAPPAASDAADSLPTPETPVEVTPSQTATPTPERVTPQRDFGRVIGELFAPPPPMRVVVLHVRDQADARAAHTIGAELIKNANVRVIIDVMAPRDPRQSGYAYFDGRQSRAAAALVTHFHDLARAQQVAEWSAQLRGIALPAQGEYTADRVDIVLPPLPAPQATPPLELQRIDPRVVRRQATTPGPN